MFLTCMSSVAAASFHIEIQNLATFYRDTCAVLGKTDLKTTCRQSMTEFSYSFNVCICRTSHRHEEKHTTGEG